MAWDNGETQVVAALSLLKFSNGVEQYSVDKRRQGFELLCEAAQRLCVGCGTAQCNGEARLGDAKQWQ